MNTHRRCRASKGQAEQHEQRDELVSRFHIGHAQCAVMATEPNFGWLQYVRQLQEVKRDHGGCHYWQLRERERKNRWVMGKVAQERIMEGGISQHLLHGHIHELFMRTILGIQWPPETFEHLSQA